MTTQNDVAHIDAPKLDFTKCVGLQNLTLVPAARDVIRQNAELACVKRWT